jgi:hypothetical protein
MATRRAAGVPGLHEEAGSGVCIELLQARRPRSRRRGVPWAIASAQTIPKPSLLEGQTTTAARR